MRATGELGKPVSDIYIRRGGSSAARKKGEARERRVIVKRAKRVYLIKKSGEIRPVMIINRAWGVTMGNARGAVCD